MGNYEGGESDSRALVIIEIGVEYPGRFLSHDDGGVVVTDGAEVVTDSVVLRDHFFYSSEE